MDAEFDSRFYRDLPVPSEEEACSSISPVDKGYVVRETALIESTAPA